MMPKVYELDPDWYIADSPEEVRQMYVEHYGSTHEEMTGEPMPEPYECDPDSELRFIGDTDDKATELLIKAGVGHIVQSPWQTVFLADMKTYAEILPKGFFCSTEF